MRILQVIMGLGVGGAEMALLRISRDLRQQGHQVKVLCLIPTKDLEKYFLKDEIEVFYLQNLIFSWPDLYRLRKFTEVLQTWMPHANFLSLIFKFLFKPKILLWNVRQTLNRFNEIRFLTQLILKGTACFSDAPDAIIYNSDCGRTDHEKLGYKPNKALVIPNGFELPSLSLTQRNSARKKYQIADQERVFLFVGRDNPDKGFKYFFEAALSLNASPLVFAVAGKGFDSQSHWARQVPQQFQNRFLFLGNLSEADIRELYMAADVINSTSITEGFSNVLGEGMAHGLLAVASDVGDSKKIVGDCGWIFPETDVPALIKAWTEILNLTDLQLQERKQNSRRQIETHYSLTVCFQAYIKAYESLLAKKGN